MVVIENQPSSSAQAAVASSLIVVHTIINNQVPGMPTIPPITPTSPAERAYSPISKIPAPIPMISNIATAIVNSTAKKFSGIKHGAHLPIRSSGMHSI